MNADFARVDWDWSELEDVTFTRCRFDDASMSATSPNGDKLYADGSGGWTAYVRGGNLFLKKFTDVPANAQASGEGEVDVYPGNGFLEFEVEGPYTMIAASGTLPWSIQWGDLDHL